MRQLLVRTSYGTAILPDDEKVSLNKPGMARKKTFRAPFLLLASGWVTSGWLGGISAAQAKDIPPLINRVAKLELQIVGNAPDHESCEQRLNAIELKLFGKVQQGGVFDRLTRIQLKLEATAANSADGPAKASDDGWPAFTVNASSPSSSGSPNLPATSGNAPSNAEMSSLSPTIAPSPSDLLNQRQISADVGQLGQTAAANPSSSQVNTEKIATVSTTLPGSQPPSDGWPAFLPRFSAPTPKIRAPLKLEVSEDTTKENAIVESLRRGPEKVAYQRASQELEHGNCKLAEKLFSMLSIKKPKDPRYFYGAGSAYRADGDIDNAFSDYVIAWHLSDDQVYSEAANALIPELQKNIDSNFKLTYGYQGKDPESILNAGTRCWKSGMTKQAIQLFEYALKNEPLYRGTAAYNLGAVAEYNGDLKLAHEYYQWAEKENARLAAEAVKAPVYAAAINKSLSLLPRGYVEEAAADVGQRLLRGDVANHTWNGWIQGSQRPVYWSSEVCPLCGISRTSATYNPGQMDLK